MANWTDLSAAFGYGTKLTSQQQQQLRDNVTAFAEGSTGTPDREEAGDNNYFTAGILSGGTYSCPGGSSWTTRVSIVFGAPGEFRFYWGYQQTENNYYTDFRIQKNGAVIIGPIRYNGTSGGDPMTYRTDDISVDTGDLIEFQAYNESASYPGNIQINLRGERRSGIMAVS